MKKMLLLVWLAVLGLVTNTVQPCLNKPGEAFDVTLAFSEDEDALLNNPMQGLYVQADTSVAPEAVAGIKADGMSLMLLACNLNGYQEKALDEAKLTEITAAFEAAEAAQVDIIFRAAYGFVEGMNTVEPASLDTALGHIAQLCEILNRYSDIVLCVQAGIIGPWGEWHSSAFLEGLSDSEQVKVRNAVAEAWLTGLRDENVIVQLRRLAFVRDAVAAGMPVQRLGFHNDALLSNRSDMNTYVGLPGIRQRELCWAEKNLRHGHFGGEMPNTSFYTNPAVAVGELKKLGAAYLNSRYNIEVLDDWKTRQYCGKNAYDYISGHLGSRLHISQVRAQKTFSADGALQMKVTLTNTGFAPAHPSLRFYLAVLQGTDVTHIPLDAASRSGKKITFDINTVLPDMDGEAACSLGIRAVFGSAESPRVFALANAQADALKLIDNTVYFAEFIPAETGWLLV